MTGRIVKGIGGFYYILAAGKEYTLKAPGRFRKEGIKPVVGDVVEFDLKGGYIDKILPRKNQFYRPAVSNVTQVFIVFTHSNPKADLILIDKLIIQSELSGINVVLVINKCDEMDDDEIEQLKEQYTAFDTICVSAKTGRGIDEIKKRIGNNVSFFAGQSGVGKSSIINCISEIFQAKTGEISQKLGRGKHTTRHVELIYIPELQGGILDTPGFSFYDFKDDETCIDDGYREFKDTRDNCKFIGCTHINEPKCAVKDGIGTVINEQRYERYKKIYSELKEMRDKRYD